HVPAGGEELEEPAELRNDGGTLDRGRDSPGRAMHGLLSSDRPRERINAVEEAGADPDGDTPVVLKLGQRAGTGLVKLADRQLPCREHVLRPRGDLGFDEAPEL